MHPALANAIPDGVLERICWPMLPSNPADSIGFAKRARPYHLRLRTTNPVPKNVRVGYVRIIEEGLSSYKWRALPYDVNAYGTNARNRTWNPEHDGNVCEAVRHTKRRIEAWIGNPTSTKTAFAQYAQ